MPLPYVIEGITAVIEQFKQGLIEVLATFENDNSATEQPGEQAGSAYSAMNQPASDESAQLLTPLQQQLQASLDALAKMEISSRRFVANEEQSTGLDFKDDSSFSKRQHQHKHRKRHQRNQGYFSALNESSEDESTSSSESDRRRKRAKRRRNKRNESNDDGATSLDNDRRTRRRNEGGRRSGTHNNNSLPNEDFVSQITMGYESSSSDSSLTRRRRQRRRRRGRGRGKRKTHSSTETIVPQIATAEEAGEEEVFPGLDEPGNGTKLKHKTGGHVCGGSGDMKVVKDLLKFTEKINFAEVKEDESELVAYIRHEGEFLTCMELFGATDLSFYDILACFRQKTMQWRHTMAPLIAKKGHFTSFTHFLREFRAAKWPTLPQLAMIELETCAQKDGEGILAYHERFVELVESMEWSIESKIDWFISGLANEEIRDCIIRRDFVNRTMDAVLKYANYLHGQLQVVEVMQRRRGR